MNPTRQLDPARLGRAFVVVDEAVQAGALPCGVLAVATRDAVIRCEAFTRPDGDQVTADHIFLLASITKPVVATAIMQLVGEGRLALSDPLTWHIPEFEQPGKPPVTVWHLLTHTSGMEEAAWIDALNIARAPAALHLLAACRSGLHFRPGTRYEYCSLSFVVLGELITRLSGQPYPDYLRDHIFAPLGMADTSFDPGPALAARTAPVHGTAGWGEGVLDYFVSLAHPGAGLWSTAADVVRFGQAFAAGGTRDGTRLLAPALVALMTRDHTADLVEMLDGHPEPVHYGLGWRRPTLTGLLPGAPEAIEHGGATGTKLWVDPAADLVIAFLTNHWGIETPVPQRVVGAVYGALE